MQSSIQSTGNNLVRTISNDLVRKDSGGKRRGRSPRSDSPTMKNAISLVIHDVRKNETLTTCAQR